MCLKLSGRGPSQYSTVSVWIKPVFHCICVDQASIPLYLCGPSQYSTVSVWIKPVFHCICVDQASIPLYLCGPSQYSTVSVWTKPVFHCICVDSWWSLAETNGRWNNWVPVGDLADRDIATASGIYCADWWMVCELHPIPDSSLSTLALFYNGATNYSVV